MSQSSPGSSWPLPFVSSPRCTGTVPNLDETGGDLDPGRGAGKEDGDEHQEAEDGDDLERHDGLERVVDFAAEDEREHRQQEDGETLARERAIDLRRRGIVPQVDRGQRRGGVGGQVGKHGAKSSSKYIGSQNRGPGSVRNLPVKIGSPV